MHLIYDPERRVILEVADHGGAERYVPVAHGITSHTLGILFASAPALLALARSVAENEQTPEAIRMEAERLSAKAGA